MLDTSNELQEALIEVIKSTANAAGKAKEFVLEQTPDVIQQLLLWQGLSKFIEFFIGMVFLMCIAYLLVKAYASQKESWVKRMRNSINNAVEHHDGPPFGAFMFMIVLLAIPISVALLNIVWLKILIAPKIYLIEYAATLVDKLI